MPAILTPALALRYLRQLSTDVRAAIVLDADGRPLAGEEAIAPSAAALAALLPAGARELVVRVDRRGASRGAALVVRGAVAAEPAAGAATSAVSAAEAPTAAEPAAGAAASDASEAAPTLVLAAGPLALLDLLRHDAATVAQALVGGAEPTGEPSPLPAGAVAVGGASRCVQMREVDGFPVQTAISAGMGLLDAAAAVSVGSGE